MRLLIFADVHSHAFRPYSEILPNGRNSRLQDTLDILEQIYYICRNQEVDGVLCGGDLFHARSVLNVATFNDVYEAIAKIKTAVKFFVLLVGNHDQSNKLGTIHSTKTFGAVVDVIDQPKWYIGEAEEETVNIFAVPFMDSKEQIVEAINTGLNTYSGDRENSATLLLGHFGVSGAEPGANFVLKSGDLPTLPDLKPQFFDQVFLGHYHMPQEPLPNVRFVGAPMQHNWGDAKQVRGIWLYDTTPGAGYATPYMQSLVAPNFVRAQATDLENNSQNFKGHFVRVVFNQHASRTDWGTIKEWLLTKAEARWAEEWLELPASQAAATGSYTPSMDLEDMIDPYVDSEADEHDLDLQLLKEMGHEFVRSCR
jgi:DNA repair exonuclease SbcCD nuclease subunit